MELNNKHIHYTAQDIAAYLSGTLNPQEMHALEKQALQDPLLADALEGFAEINEVQSKKHLQEINEVFVSKINKYNTKVMPLYKFRFSKLWYGVAAVGLIAIIFSVIFKINSNKKLNVNIAKNQNGLKQNNEFKNNNVIRDSFENSSEEDKFKANIEKNKSTIELALSDLKIPNDTVQDDYSKKNNESLSDIAVVEKKENINQEAKAALTFDLAKPAPPTIVTVNENELIKEKYQTNTQVKPNSNNYSNNSQYNQNINGRVINQENQPVGFASVKVNNSKVATTANAEGYFNIPINQNDSSVLINVNAVGYQATKLNIQNNPNSLNNNSNIVKLEADKTVLNDVVVSNFGTKKVGNKISQRDREKKLSLDTSIIPEGGWPAFYDYLERNRAYTSTSVDSTVGYNKITNKFSPNQEVVLSFNVDEEGNPIHIKVERSTNKSEEKKAVDLLKNGPKWKNLSKKQKHKLQLQFKN